MNKEDRQFVYEASAKAALELIPGIGGCIASILGDTLADRKEERFREMLKGLASEIEANRERVDAEFVSKGDFLDIFESITKRVVNERSEEKRLAYRNILLAGIFSSAGDYDQVEYQMRILDQLDRDHITILFIFYHLNEFLQKYKCDPPNDTTLHGFLRRALPFEFDYLYDVLTDLENLRLLTDARSSLRTMTSGINRETISSKRTKKGTEFIAFIVR